MAPSPSDDFKERSRIARNKARIRLATEFNLEGFPKNPGRGIESWRIEINARNSKWIILSIPPAFPLALPEVFVNSDDLFGQVAHLNSKGKLCYCDEATSAIIGDDPCEIAMFAVSAAKQILDRPLEDFRDDEFATEYDHYWEATQFFYCLLEDTDTPREIDLLFLDSEHSPHVVALVHENEEDALRWLHQSRLARHIGKGKGFFIPNVIPPKPPYPLTNEDMCALMENASRDVRQAWARHLGNSKNRAVYVTTVVSSRGKSVVGWIHTKQLVNRDKYRPTRGAHSIPGFRPGKAPPAWEVAHIWGNNERILKLNGIELTRERLENRTTGTKGSTFSEVLVVGLGSIGGELALKMAVCHQISNITLVDDDFLKVENIPRHAGTFEDVGRPKAEVVARLIGRNSPWTKVEPVSKNALDCLDLLVKRIESVDNIILATGNWAVEAFILDLFYSNAKPKAVAHQVWVTSGANEGHVVRYVKGKRGCHRCQPAPLPTPNSGDVNYEAGCSAGFANYGGSRLSRFLAEACDKALLPPLGAWHMTWTVRQQDDTFEQDRVTREPTPEEGSCDTCS